jgi:hypothetical protein
MKPLRNTTTGYVPTALAMASVLLASQPARASVLLFAMSPQISFAAPGAAEALEVHLANTGPDPVMIAGFSLDLTTTDPGMIFNDVTTSTLETYIFSGNSRFGPDIATNFTPDVAARRLAFTGSSTLDAGAAVGLGYVTYSIAPDAGLGDVFGIRVASPGIGTSLSGGVGDDISIIGDEMKNGAVTDVPGPKALLPAGLLLIGLGSFRRRQIRVGRRRRKIPGIRKAPMYEGRAPSQANPGARYSAA